MTPPLRPVKYHEPGRYLWSSDSCVFLVPFTAVLVLVLLGTVLGTAVPDLVRVLNLVGTVALVVPLARSGSDAVCERADLPVM